MFRTTHWVDGGFTEKTIPEGRKPALLFAGRLSDEKGVMDLVPIAEIVRKTHPDLEVWFVDEGPSNGKAEKTSLASPVLRMVGWVEKKELTRIYSEAGILVLPSTFDTFGCGLPVAAYRSK